MQRRGFKVVMLPSFVKRPIAAIADSAIETTRFAWRADTFGIDSEHDYDPVWAKCRELGVVAASTVPGEGSTFHDSISNPVYNHVGHFAAAATAVCKSLFLGGVSQRFPELRFLFLEGGVGWARSLLADLTGHWEKRSLDGLATDSDPRLADLDLFLDLYRRYGGSLWRRTTRDELAQRWDVHPEDPSDSFARLACHHEGRAPACSSIASTSDARATIPSRVGVRRHAQPRRPAPARDRSAPTSGTGTCRSWTGCSKRSTNR